MQENNISQEELINKYKNELMAYYKNVKRKYNLENSTQTAAMQNEVPEKTNQEELQQITNNEIPNTQELTQPLNVPEQLNSDKELSAEELYKIFKKENDNVGYLKVQTLTARRTFPVPNAKVYVIKSFDKDKNYLITTAETDESGLTPIFELPAKSKEVSETPGVDHPYTTYTIIIEHPDFITMKYENVPVFEGVISTQTADMVLKSAATPKEFIINVDEQEPDVLN